MLREKNAFISHGGGYFVVETRGGWSSRVIVDVLEKESDKYNMYSGGVRGMAQNSVRDRTLEFQAYVNSLQQEQQATSSTGLDRQENGGNWQLTVMKDDDRQ